MRILYASQYYPPEMGAPAARVSELAQAWAAAGHEVTVLTGMPNHPTGVVPPDYRGRVIVREEVQGVRVLRSWVYATPNRGVVRRSLAYASFATSAAALGQWYCEPPDVVVATSPQFLVAVAGWLVAKCRNVPFVFEVRDLWPESIVAVGALSSNHPGIRALEVLERGLYAQAQRIVVVTHRFRDRLVSRGVASDKIKVITNGVDLGRFNPMVDGAPVRSSLGISPERVLVSYVGTHGMAHALGAVLDVAARCRNSQILFLFVGEGAEKESLVRRASQERLGNVMFLAPQPREAIPGIYAASDICLVPLRKTDLFTTVIPSKIFEILGMGRPLILSVDGEARELVEASGGGLFAPPEDVGAILAAIERLAADKDLRVAMGEAGRDFVRRQYDREGLARMYLEELEAVALEGAKYRQTCAQRTNGHHCASKR